jgi:methionyl-tRNA formyltransferase
MYMDEGLDTGDMLLMREMKIRRRETGGSLHDRMAEEAPGALAVALAMLANGSAPRVPQPVEGVTYAGKLGRESGELDWAAGRVAIERRIRAMNPWPAAATTLPTREGAKRLKVFSAIQCRKISGPPGIVLAADSRGLLVGAGDGALRLTDIQLEGKRRMRAGEFLLGNPVAPGTKLGA